MDLPIQGIWNGYKKLLHHLVKGKFAYVKDGNWRDAMFIKIVLYATPIALIALIPSVIIMVDDGRLYLAAFDVLAYLSVPLVSLNNKIKLHNRQAVVVIVFYLLAITNTALLGSFGIGGIYLLAISVFTALLFPNKIVVRSVMANFFIYLCFALIIYFKLLNSPLITAYSVKLWLFHASNFLFLNLAVILIIRLIINGLENNLSKAAALSANLKKEINDKELLNEQLSESEGHYKSLFIRNPSPMWIFDAQNLQFLQVNAAAIRQYGYTRAEFKSMTIKDIRRKDDVKKLLNILEKLNDKTHTSLTTVRHLRKSGEEFYAEVRCSEIPYKGKKERLVIARDITDHIDYTLAIEKQNAQLREIAYMQSHVVRAPLSRILGLVYLIKNVKDEIDAELVDHLDTSARELDDVIKNIIIKAGEKDGQFIYNKTKSE